MEIVNNNLKNFIITGIYYLPKGNIKSFKDYCKELLSKKKTSDKNVFIVGNFNINSLDYEYNEPVKNFFNLIFQNGFLPLNQRATRVTKTTATAIDHIITDTICKNKMTSGITKTDITDHFPIFTILEKYNKNPPEKTKIMKRDFSEENIHTFEFLLKNIDWNRLLPLDSPNLAYGNFLKEIEIKTKHLGTPWITKSLQKSSKRKQRLYEKFLKRRTIENENQYKTYKNLFEKIKKNAKKNYYQRKLELYENNIKKYLESNERNNWQK